MSELRALPAFDKVLKHTTRHYLDRARANPFLKWAGGKRALIPEIVKVLPDEFNTYWEPFCGGGAVFFALDSRISKAWLSDSNTELMITYVMLKKNVDAVIDELKRHEEKHGKEYYLKIRKNGHTCEDPVKLAARFIYLNRTCFNGLYRVNKSGQFNVPIGSYVNPSICNEDNLRAAAEVLAKAVIKMCPFEKINPEAGDLVYCDPPYDETFTGYTGNGFDTADQTALRNRCLEWIDKGASVILSNSDTRLIRGLYDIGEEFDVREVQAPRNINCKGNGRAKVVELLIVSR